MGYGTTCLNDVWTATEMMEVITDRRDHSLRPWRPLEVLRGWGTQVAICTLKNGDMRYGYNMLKNMKKHGKTLLQIVKFPTNWKHT